MKKLKKDNIFILISLIFLISCCVFYGYRLIYYYKLENPKVEKLDTLYELLTMEKNVTKVGEGLYNEDEKYIYKGKNVNNYLEYSGRLFRIVSIDKDGYIKLITDENQTSLVWGYEQNYDNSYIRKWLNDENNKYKSFIQSLDNISGTLVTNKTSVDIIKNDKAVFNKEISDKAGLISLYEYNKAGSSQSYLNNGEIFWTSNIDENGNVYYVYDDGSILKDSNNKNTYKILGVRPTITISANLSNFDGNGTKEDPYKINFEKGNNVGDKYVGEYIKLDNQVLRIIEKGKDYIKVVTPKNIDNLNQSYGTTNYFSTNNGIGSYLNKTLYNSLSYKDKILLGIFNTGKYDRTNKYDFNDTADYTEKAYIGLLNIGELFLNEDENYYLGSRTITTAKTAYELQENGFIFAQDISKKSGIRITFHLDNTLEVSNGKGTFKDPYIIK